MSDTPTYQDPTASLDDRIEDLLGRMTIQEKMTQIHYQSPAIERLGVNEYNWWNEACHGVARNGKATVFPQVIGLGATFDPDLVKRVYRTVALEARAKYAQSALNGRRNQYRGLTFWTPNINIFRDPRWGRGQETYGECPWLMAQMGVATVEGLQGDNPEEELLTAACAKHYAVHSGPEAERHTFNAMPTNKDLWETYLPAFKALVDAGVETVMGAYNRTLDEPCCGSYFLLDEVLRKMWGFKGHVVSDCWAIKDFHDHHKVTPTPAESAALALKAGCDLNCGCVYEEMPVALEQGLVTEEHINIALRRLLRTRFRLGQFDETEDKLKEMAQVCDVACAEHRALAKEAAHKSIVLAKNDGVLPLRKDAIEVFATGPLAASVDALIGNYNGLNTDMSTILEGVIKSMGPSGNLAYKKGFLATHPNDNDADWIGGEINAADVGLVVCGIDGSIEGEEGDAIASAIKGDRDRVKLPQHQIDFIGKILDRCEGETPIILVVVGGSAVSLGPLAERASAIIYCWYPGEAGGDAVADVMFGDVSPSGRMPVSVPKSVDDLPAFDDYTMKGRTYRYSEIEPQFPFGFGLSYTTFAYADLHVPSTVTKGEAIPVTLSVTNTGAVASDDVVQIYVRDDEASCDRPLQQLVGVARVESLQPGESRSVLLEIDPQDLWLVTETGERVLEEGSFTVTAGGCVPGERGEALGASKAISTQFDLK